MESVDNTRPAIGLVSEHQEMIPPLLKWFLQLDCDFIVIHRYEDAIDIAVKKKLDFLMIDCLVHRLALQSGLSYERGFELAGRLLLELPDLSFCTIRNSEGLGNKIKGCCQHGFCHKMGTYRCLIYPFSLSEMIELAERNGVHIVPGCGSSELI